MGGLSVFTALRALVSRWFGLPSQNAGRGVTAPTQSVPDFLRAHPQSPVRPESFEKIEASSAEQDHGTFEGLTRTGHPVPYDENLLERSRTQWQFGDWHSLAKLDREKLKHHPDRAKLALLAAAGHLQTGNPNAARPFVRLAQDWGCSKKLVSQLLVAGLHNSLGRAALANGQDERARRHFEDAIRVALPKADNKLFSEARAVREAAKLGLLPQAAKLMSDQLVAIGQQGSLDRSRLRIFATELDLLHHELSLAQQRQQILSPNAATNTSLEEISAAEWRARLAQKSVSQLGQDLWVLEKSGYKRGGFFVEFGATDGVLLSNTWLLEKEFGWSGICAEPNPKFYEQLKANRHCAVSRACIAGETASQVDFILADAYGCIAKYAQNDMHGDKRAAYQAAGQIARLATISLDEFLAEHAAPDVIDYLSIDTEGSEFEILSAFPFEKWHIKLITVEHNFTPQRIAIRQLLQGKGYRCTEQQFDDWYEQVGR